MVQISHQAGSGSRCLTLINLKRYDQDVQHTAYQHCVELSKWPKCKNFVSRIPGLLFKYNLKKSKF